jgi:hypothetical protein
MLQQLQQQGVLAFLYIQNDLLHDVYFGTKVSISGNPRTTSTVSTLNRITDGNKSNIYRSLPISAAQSLRAFRKGMQISLMVV